MKTPQSAGRALNTTKCGVDGASRDRETLTLASFDITRAMVYPRRAGVAAILVWLLLFVSLEPVPWRFALLALALAAFAGSMITPGWRYLGALLGGAERRLLLLYLGQGVLIFTTGGIESPLTVLIPLTAMAMGFATGRWDALPWALGGLLLYVIVLVGLWSMGVVLLPTFLAGASSEQWSDLWVLLLTMFLGFGVVGGGVSGMSIRLILERTHTRALGWEREARQVSQQCNEDLLRMSGSLAHELKNPLMAIQGLSTLMVSQSAEGSRDEKRLQVLVSEVERMGSIVEGFLTLARPVDTLALEAVDVEALLQELMILVEGVARQRAVELAVEPTALSLTCDPNKVRQILLNLVQNALEASEEGGKVTLSAHRDARRVVLRVEDEGPGPDPERPLFAPGVTTKPDGSGLGLTIARVLAEQHRGALTLQRRGDRRGCRADVAFPDPPEPEAAP